MLSDVFLPKRMYPSKGRDMNQNQTLEDILLVLNFKLPFTILKKCYVVVTLMKYSVWAVDMKCELVLWSIISENRIEVDFQR